MDRRRFARGHSRDIRASNDDILLPPLQLMGSEPSDLSVSFPLRKADCLGASTCRRGTICRATAAENTTNHADSWRTPARIDWVWLLCRTVRTPIGPVSVLSY